MGDQDGCDVIVKELCTREPSLRPSIGLRTTAYQLNGLPTMSKVASELEGGRLQQVSPDDEDALRLLGQWVCISMCRLRGQHCTK